MQIKLMDNKRPIFIASIKSKELSVLLDTGVTFSVFTDSEEVLVRYSPDAIFN